MELRQPKTEHEFHALLQMLQQSLRSADSPFAIADEYPLMLKSDKSYSYCLFDKNQPIAHAHLWCRHINPGVGHAPLRVGLIGNVATAATHRGQGLMRHLFRELDHCAQAMDLKALILWSDLDQFYQNLGYASLGEEIRFKGRTNHLARRTEGLPPFVPIHPNDLSNQELSDLLSLRPKSTLTLERSADEFRAQLSIPATGLFVSRMDEQMCGYAVMGKGMDMWGVIHEWGCQKPEHLAHAAYDIGRRIQLDEVMVLTPATLPRGWMEKLTQTFEHHEKFPMAWGKILANGENLKSLFIWGLDSI